MLWESADIDDLISKKASPDFSSGGAFLTIKIEKKTKTKNIAGDVYTSKVESFTHGTTYDIIVSKRFLDENDKVLIVDDFLAIGNALNGLIALVNDSGASLAGCGVVIEKGFQHGGDKLRSNGIKVESLAIVESMDHETGKVYFRD